MSKKTIKSVFTLSAKPKGLFTCLLSIERILVKCVRLQWHFKSIYCKQRKSTIERRRKIGKRRWKERNCLALYVYLTLIPGGEANWPPPPFFNVAQKPFELWPLWLFPNMSQNFCLIDNCFVYFTGTFCRHNRSSHYGLWATAIIIRSMLTFVLVDLYIINENITLKICM